MPQNGRHLNGQFVERAEAFLLRSFSFSCPAIWWHKFIDILRMQAWHHGMVQPKWAYSLIRISRMMVLCAAVIYVTVASQKLSTPMEIAAAQMYAVRFVQKPPHRFCIMWTMRWQMKLWLTKRDSSAGDIGYFDDNGRLFIKDRKKNVFTIFYFDGVLVPFELEECLLNMPGVNEVCVVGVKIADGAALPAALIIPKSNAHLTKSEVFEMIAGENHENRSESNACCAKIIIII